MPVLVVKNFDSVHHIVYNKDHNSDALPTHRPNTSNPMLDGVPKQQEDRQSRRGGSNPSTSTGSSRTNSSADGNSGDDLDVAGVGAGAAPSAGKASTAGRVDEAVSRAFTGEAWRTQLEGAKPAAQSPTVQPEFEQVSSLWKKS